jgi:hypothetical protein
MGDPVAINLQKLNILLDPDYQLKYNKFLRTYLGVNVFEPNIH